MNYNTINLETYTVEDFQKDFDNLLSRVENGEQFLITDGNNKCIIMPCKEYELSVEDDLVRIHTNHHDAC
jgi:PHD/YefM family antitoxin component YafN of YafNO toxin-antitoxin module